MTNLLGLNNKPSFRNPFVDSLADQPIINIATSLDSDESQKHANAIKTHFVTSGCAMVVEFDRQMVQKANQLSNELAAKLPDDASSDYQFQLDALDEHNKLRAIHGCPPLKLNRNLCNFAKEWAKYLAGRNTLQHRSNNKYGENLYMSSGMEVNGRTAVRSWYDEIKSYRFEYGGFIIGTDNFTQVVWKGSREMGVAFVKSGNRTYVVANYDPPGNFARKFRENVPPPHCENYNNL